MSGVCPFFSFVRLFLWTVAFCDSCFSPALSVLRCRTAGLPVGRAQPSMALHAWAAKCSMAATVALWLAQGGGALNSQEEHNLALCIYILQKIYI